MPLASPFSMAAPPSWMSKLAVAKDFAVEMRVPDVALETFWPSWLRLTVANPILSFLAIWVGAA